MKTTSIFYPLCLTLLFSFFSLTVFSQEQFMFRHLAARDGLSHNQVNSIYKDSQGFMWFGTAGGLNRYDGYGFRTFRYDEKDPWSLIDNYIEEIQEDYNGNLWIHTASGYVIYDRKSETFLRDIPAVLKKTGLEFDGTVERVYIDKKKNTWLYVAGTGGFQYQNEDRKWIFYPQGRPGGLSEGTVTGLSASAEGGLFVFEDGRLECVDFHAGNVIRRDTYIPDHSTFISDKYSLFVDSEGDYWVYSKASSGTWYFDRSQAKWQHFTDNSHSFPFRLSSNVIQGVAEDRKGRIWLATDHGGVDIIDKATGYLQNLRHEVTDPRSISNNSINCVYIDEVDLIWIGTYKKGVSYYGESMFKFALEDFAEYKLTRNFDSDITYIQPDNQGYIWLGTNGNGLVRWNRVTGDKKLYEPDPDSRGGLSSGVIVGMCAARDGKLWIGTYLGGLNSFDGHTFTRYMPERGNPNSLADINVWSIIEDEDETLWIAILGGGLQHFDPKSGNFTTYAGTEYLTSDYVSSLCFGRNDVIYIGTAVGLTIYHKKTKRFEQLAGNRSGSKEWSNRNIHQVFEDSRGLLWIGTRDGLNVFDLKADTIGVIRQADGLAGDIICAITEDNDRNIWVTTSSGVSNIIVSTDPRSGNYTYDYHNYTDVDGLQSGEFNMRSIARTFRGEILMGGNNGFNIFQPGNIHYDASLPRVIFTGLTLFNQEVKVDTVYSGNKILDVSLADTDRIELKYRQNVFSISFSGMNYILPEKTEYAYMLKGFNTDWLYTEDGQHGVTYTNLAPGKYTLLIKAANSDGVWNEEPTELSIRIRPPFWRSGGAYTLYAFLILSALLFARYLLLRSERHKFEVKQLELESERNMELNEMKLRFFTNISHDLRTPLTLIISPLENMIRTMPMEEYKQKLVMVHRNSLRLLNLVNQLLDFRKSDVSGHLLSPITEDVIPFMKNICQSFVQISEKKGITLHFSSPLHVLWMEFDEDKLGKIMMNLLSNAFKFTEEGGEVHIFVNLLPATADSPEQLEVRVADTGIGIRDEDKERVFERFYQVQHSDEHKFIGSGIGLHMVKEFVALHYGYVWVEDNTPKGSVFVFTIPVVRAALNQEALTTLQSGQEEGDEVTFVQTSGVEVLQEEEMPALLTEAPMVLLVDDNADFRYFLKDCLKGNYRIEEAATGLEAWKMIPDLQPDIIICDVMMPELDGHEVCRLVKSDIRTSHIPLILLTARSADEEKVEGLSIGADDYITKPFNFEILSLRIKKLLEICQQQQEQFNGQIDPVPSEIAITSLDEKLIRRAVQYVEDHMNRSDLSVEELSRELGMSRVHLYKKLMAITGKSPIEFIRVIRLKRAAQLLRESQLNVSEIAYEVGFNSPKYFSKYFKEEFGVLPSDYKGR
ncbi:MAG: response regulator [Bacteroides sp.]|nr:response regulator [Bacteroides sp.]